MRTLGEDVLLLALRENGTVAAAEKMRFALAGSELVRLAEAGRVEIVKGRIVVLDPEPTQDPLSDSLPDPLLDAALASIRTAKRPPRAKDWVAGRAGMTRQYLQRLIDSGAVRLEVRKALRVFTVRRWFVLDRERVGRLRAELDAIADSEGPVDSPQAALGGLVYAVGLGASLYPGAEGRSARKRLEWIAKHNAAADAVGGAVADAARAAIRASIDAAVSASVDAVHHAATAGDGGGGGHHG
jgi:hypothetical protein